MQVTLTYLEAGVAAQVEGGERGVGGHAQPHLLEVLAVQLVAWVKKNGKWRERVSNLCNRSNKIMEVKCFCLKLIE